MTRMELACSTPVNHAGTVLEPSPQDNVIPARFTCQWLSEGTGNRFNAMAGRDAEAHGGMLDPLLLLLAGLSESDRASLAAALSSYSEWRRLPRLARRRIEDAFRPVRDVSGWEDLVAGIARLAGFRDRILEQAPRAISRQRTMSPADVPSETHVPRFQLDLPVLDKKLWRRRAEILPRCQISVDDTGRIAVRPPGVAECDCNLEFQTALAIGAGFAGCRNHFHLSFADRRVVSRESIHMTLLPLLAAYGAVAPILPPAWEQLSVSITVRTAGQAARAWIQTPKERTLNRYSAYAAIAQQTQQSLRVWMPYLHFASHEFFKDRDFACAMLAYQAGKPYHHKGKPEYCYDPMVRSSVALACHNIRPRLAGLLATAHRRLTSAGLHDLAAHYHPKYASRIIENVKVGNRRFLTLLALDGLVMDRFDKLGNACRLQKRLTEESPEEGARYVLRDVREVNRAFQGRLRRLSSLEDLSWIGALLTVEASAALATHFGQPSPIELIVHVSNAAQAGRPVILRASKLPACSPA